MKTITVTASRTYSVKIGSGLLNTVGSEVTALGKAEKVCVVSDSNVFPLYGEQVCKNLQLSGLEVFRFIFPSGEQSKNGTVFLKLLNHLAVAQLTRSDIIVALGGGVVGDLAGFAASCYLRGIRFVQLPTTLLAAVDSSVGGKTAIDLPAGKNLAGAFCQPSLVLCDTDTLNTLPEAVFRDGCAEIIKYSILYDPGLFAHLEEKGLCFDREAVISRCVELKRDVVSEDEFDTGARRKLNLGHTIGHGIEARSNFSVSHGQAVGIGTAIVCRIAAKNGLCTEDTCNSVVRLLKQFGLPVDTSYTAEELYTHTLTDKKRSGSTIHLIVPRKIGSCDILPISVTELESLIQAGL